jgi:hypothetical protein
MEDNTTLVVFLEKAVRAREIFEDSYSHLQKRHMKTSKDCAKEVFSNKVEAEIAENFIKIFPDELELWLKKISNSSSKQK